MYRRGFPAPFIYGQPEKHNRFGIANLERAWPANLKTFQKFIAD